MENKDNKENGAIKKIDTSWGHRPRTNRSMENPKAMEEGTGTMHARAITDGISDGFAQRCRWCSSASCSVIYGIHLLEKTS
jgi:hypothetical protein